MATQQTGNPVGISPDEVGAFRLGVLRLGAEPGEFTLSARPADQPDDGVVKVVVVKRQNVAMTIQDRQGSPWVDLALKRIQGGLLGM